MCSILIRWVFSTGDERINTERPSFVPFKYMPLSIKDVSKIIAFHNLWMKSNISIIVLWERLLQRFSSWSVLFKKFIDPVWNHLFCWSSYWPLLIKSHFLDLKLNLGLLKMSCFVLQITYGLPKFIPYFTKTINT